MLAAARRPFLATGLGVPWYAVHGNHDNMLQGSVPADGWLRDFPAGAVKFVSPPDDIDALAALSLFDAAAGPGQLQPIQAQVLADIGRGSQLAVTPDPGRLPVTRAAHVGEHFRTCGRPAGHGYSRRNLAEGTAYYWFDHGAVRCIVLDTVNPHGGWQGSLDAAQLGWLAADSLRALTGRWCCSATIRWKLS